MANRSPATSVIWRVAAPQPLFGRLKMFWFRPWHHHHMWHHHYRGGCAPFGCFWLLLAPFFFCALWAVFGAFSRMIWW